MCKEAYNAMNQKLAPDAALVQSTLEKMAERRQGVRWEKPRPRRRGLAVGLAAAVLLGVSLTAVAAAPQLGQFWAGLSARYGEHLQPVDPPSQAASTGEIPATVQADVTGPLRVLAAAVDRDNAEVYFTIAGQPGEIGMDTLALGELRVGSTAVPVSAMPVYCDGETGTAVFCQHITVPDGMDGSDAALSITSVLDKGGQGEDASFGFNLGDLELTESPETVAYTLSPAEDALAQSWQARYEQVVDNGAMAFLKPGAGWDIPGADGIAVSAAGYVDGRLHIQLRVDEPWRYALAPSGQTCSEPEFEPNASYSAYTFDTYFQMEGGAVTQIFDKTLNGKNGGDPLDELRGYGYVEIVCGIPQESLAYWDWSFILRGYAEIRKDLGEQAFTLGSSSLLAVAENLAPFTVDVETLHLPEDGGEEFSSTWAAASFDGLRATPFAVTVSREAREEDGMPQIDGILKRYAPDVSKLEITAETDEGTHTYTLDPNGYTVTPDGSGRMVARYLPDEPVEPEEIRSLRVNGVDVPLGAYKGNGEGRYEPLQAAGLDVTHVAVREEEVRIEGHGIWGTVESVQLVCGGELIPCTAMDESFTELTCGVEGSGSIDGLFYTPEKPFDLASVTGIQINGIEVALA